MANFLEDSFNTGSRVRQKVLRAEYAGNSKLTVKFMMFITSSGGLGLMLFKKCM